MRLNARLRVHHPRGVPSARSSDVTRVCEVPEAPVSYVKTELRPVFSYTSPGGTPRRSYPGFNLKGQAQDNIAISTV